MIVTINKQPFQVTSPYGSLDSMHSTGHTGVDLAMPIGTPIYSPTDGVVDNVVNYGNDNIGLGVIVKTPDGNHVILGHLSKVNVRIGDTIHAGQKIAESGNSGNSSGAHLHIGLMDNTGHFANPTKYEQVFQQVSANNQHWSLTNNPLTQAKDNISSLASFINDMRANGLFHAIYGESFHEAMSNGWEHFLHWMGKALLEANDIIFLFPAIAFALLTFFIGKNKFTKWIAPLTFFYAISEILYICNGGN